MIILSLITIYLDGVISCYLPYLNNTLNYTFPLLTVTIIPIIYPYIKKDKYLTYSSILGLIFDLLYSNIFLLNTITFLVIGYIIKKIYHIFRNSFMINLLAFIISIITYDLLMFITSYLLGNHTININNLIQKIISSIPLNLIYFFLVYIILDTLFNKKIIKRYVR